MLFCLHSSSLFRISSTNLSTRVVFEPLFNTVSALISFAPSSFFSFSFFAPFSTVFRLVYSPYKLYACTKCIVYACSYHSCVPPCYSIRFNFWCSNFSMQKLYASRFERIYVFVRFGFSFFFPVSSVFFSCLVFTSQDWEDLRKKYVYPKEAKNNSWIRMWNAIKNKNRPKKSEEWTATQTCRHAHTPTRNKKEQENEDRKKPYRIKYKSVNSVKCSKIMQLSSNPKIQHKTK